VGCLVGSHMGCLVGSRVWFLGMEQAGSSGLEHILERISPSV